jgi:hypothetical protein
MSWPRNKIISQIQAQSGLVKKGRKEFMAQDYLEEEDRNSTKNLQYKNYAKKTGNPVFSNK